MSGRTKIDYIPIGAIPIHFGVTASEKAYEREMARLGIKDYGPWVSPGAFATTHLFEHNSEVNGFNKTVLICFKDVGKFRFANAAHVAHEAFHVTQFCFEAMQEDRPGEEVTAYLLQLIVESVLHSLCGK